MAVAEVGTVADTEEAFAVAPVGTARTEHGEGEPFFLCSCAAAEYILIQRKRTRILIHEKHESEHAARSAFLFSCPFDFLSGRFFMYAMLSPYSYFVMLFQSHKYTMQMIPAVYFAFELSTKSVINNRSFNLFAISLQRNSL